MVKWSKINADNDRMKRLHKNVRRSEEILEKAKAQSSAFHRADPDLQESTFGWQLIDSALEHEDIRNGTRRVVVYDPKNGIVVAEWFEYLKQWTSDYEAQEPTHWIDLDAPVCKTIAEL